LKIGNQNHSRYFRQQHQENAVKFSSGTNYISEENNTQTGSNNKIEFKDIKENLKEGFKEGAVEFWETLKKPKNILIALGITGLGFGGLTTLGLSFASCNVLFFGIFAGLGIFAAGKNIKNYFEHKNDNQNNLARNDIKNVGKNIFDISVITVPFGISALLRAVKCTYTYLETASMIKTSKLGNFVTCQSGRLAGFLSNLVDFEKINFEKLKLIKKLNKFNPKNTLAKTRIISGINDFSSGMIHLRGEFESKIIDLIDNKIGLNFSKNRISSAKLFKYMDDYKHYYSKIIDEINKNFDNATIRQKSFARLTKKAWRKKATPESIHEKIRDFIGARIVLYSPEEFESAFNSLKRLANEGKLVEVESHHGKGMTHFFTEEQELYLKQKGVKFVNNEKENGYQTINAIVKYKDASKKCASKYYEVQIRGKHIDAVDSVEHKCYEKDRTGKLGTEKYGNLYNEAAKADLGQPVSKKFFEMLDEIFDPFYRFKCKINSTFSSFVSKAPRFIPGSIRVNTNNRITINSSNIRETNNEAYS
jgi:ppGpp synthetase/RelA/SpoT-type nucleotidyltranferase